MRKSSPAPLLKCLLASAGVTLATTGCLSPEELAALNSSLELGSDPSPQAPAPEVAPACFNERFVQPEAEISRSIDLLFVMDTSGSMADNRAKAADGISAFVAELPPQVDYQIGVMLAHGSKSTWSGKLFRHNNVTVFSSKTMSLSSIQSQLRTMVLSVPNDASGEQGEEGAYSLMKGLTTRLATNKQAGFFRDDAALAIVFVADENDICAPYAGMTTFPGLTNAEKALRNRDCSGGIATQTVINQVKAIQGTRPYLFGAVTHVQPNYHDQAGNDSYGYGYMEFVQATKGVSTEINDGSYTQGLSELGKLATIKLNLLLDFTLARPEVNPATLKAQVDGIDTAFTFDIEGNEVHLSSGGTAKSVVDINYCLKQAAPSPAPSPTPSPTPIPTFTIPPN